VPRQPGPDGASHAPFQRAIYDLWVRGHPQDAEEMPSRSRPPSDAAYHAAAAPTNNGAAVENEPDNGAKRATDFVEGAKICCIPGEQGGGGKPGDCCKRAAPGDPLPARFSTARAVPIDQSEPERDEHQQDWPPSDLGLAIVVAVWMTLNLLAGPLGYRAPDPPPFSCLEGAVSLASLYIVVLILATQRREDQLTQRREQLTLELAILSEQKTAKIIQLRCVFRSKVITDSGGR
jgi:hypothetical protein